MSNLKSVRDPEELQEIEEGENQDVPELMLEEQARREYENEYWRNPRVRRCLGCEDAVLDENDPRAECAIHGDPYEEPFEFELRFQELFGHSPWEDPKAEKTPLT